MNRLMRSVRPNPTATSDQPISGGTVTSIGWRIPPEQAFRIAPIMR
jgi:hypothetical protein